MCLYCGSPTYLSVGNYCVTCCEVTELLSFTTLKFDVIQKRRNALTLQDVDVMVAVCTLLFRLLMQRLNIFCPKIDAESLTF